MPGILRLVFDLLWIDVVKNRALLNLLLPMKRVEFCTLSIDALEGLYLLSHVPYIIASIKVSVDALTTSLFMLLSYIQCHFSQILNKNN